MISKTKSFCLLTIVHIISICEIQAFRRVSVAKQHETPMDHIALDRFPLKDSNDIPRKVWPRAKELMQQRPSTRLDFKESFDLQSTTSNANKKFDLRDGKVEVWLFVASAIFGAVFSLMIFQLFRLLRVHCLTFKPASCCHGEPQKAIDKVIHEGLKSVVKTKKVVVMNIHLIPCDGDNCDQVQAKGMVLTKDYNNCPKEIYHGKDTIHCV